MPRPKRHRMMNRPPAMKGLRPFGIPVNEIGTLTMLFEEYEALKLADYELLTQADAAQVMNISRPTFTRIYENARRIVARALAEGKAIEITGGNVLFAKNWYKCNDCYHLFDAERGHYIKHCNECGSDNIYSIAHELENESKMQQEQQQGGMGAGGMCICLKCGAQKPHEDGVPCRDERCPNCGKPMFREGSYHHREFLRKQARKNQENKDNEEMNG